MKKCIFIIAIILLSASLVQAANLYKEDFSRGNTQSFNLKEKDTIRVNITGKETEIMLRSVFPEKNSAKLTIFIQDAETPQYTTIQASSKVFIDIDKNREKDLLIQAIYISQENTILSITDLSITGLGSAPEVTGLAVEGTKPESGNPKSTFLIGVLITLSIIVLGLLLYFIFRKRQ